MFSDSSNTNGYAYSPFSKCFYLYFSRMCSTVYMFSLPVYFLLFFDEPSNHWHHSSPVLNKKHTINPNVECIKGKVLIGLHKDDSLDGGSRVVEGFGGLNVNVEVFIPLVTIAHDLIFVQLLSKNQYFNFSIYLQLISSFPKLNFKSKRRKLKKQLKIKNSVLDCLYYGLQRGLLHVFKHFDNFLPLFFACLDILQEWMV